MNIWSHQRFRWRFWCKHVHLMFLILPAVDEGFEEARVRSSHFWGTEHVGDLRVLNTSKVFLASIFSTARCSISRNSLRGITHSIIHSHILHIAVLPPALMVFFTFKDCLWLLIKIIVIWAINLQSCSIGRGKLRAVEIGWCAQVWAISLYLVPNLKGRQSANMR